MLTSVIVFLFYMKKVGLTVQIKIRLQVSKKHRSKRLK